MMNSPDDSPSNFFALHGFLGSPADWNRFDSFNRPVEIKHEEFDLWAWSHAFNSAIKKNSGKNILMGYSLGGRLAMHALLSKPSLWDAAILVSAHPGLTSSTERAARLRSDQHWSQRFVEDPWDVLMRDWNSQAVFGTHPSPFSRLEAEVDRNKLSQQLINWSLGKQEPLLDRLRQLSIPILILAGELDTKFCTQTEQFKEFSTVSIIPDAAHRLPWEQPEKFMKEVQKFCHENSLPLL